MAVSVYGFPRPLGWSASHPRIAVGRKEPKLGQEVLSRMTSPVPHSPEHCMLLSFWGFPSGCHALQGVLQRFVTWITNWTSWPIYIFKLKVQVTANLWSAGGRCGATVVALLLLHGMSPGRGHLPSGQHVWPRHSPGKRHIHDPLWRSFLHRVSNC